MKWGGHPARAAQSKPRGICALRNILLVLLFADVCSLCALGKTSTLLCSKAAFLSLSGKSPFDISAYPNKMMRGDL